MSEQSDEELIERIADYIYGRRNFLPLELGHGILELIRETHEVREKINNGN